MIERLVQKIKCFHQDQNGQGMAEYGLIIALVAVIAIGAFVILGNGVKDKINSAADALK